MSSRVPEISVGRFRVVRLPDSRTVSNHRCTLPRDSRVRVLPVSPIVCSAAQTRADFTGAFELLQHRYRESGLATDPSEMRIMPYHLWPKTQIFVARQNESVAGTISLIRDSLATGLPMESTYRSTIASLRRQGYHLGEVCSLAATSIGAAPSGEVFAQLTRLMTFHARHIGLDYLLAVVHPRHAKFYERAMGFERIGNVTEYDQVGGRPGIPVLGRVNDRASCRPRWQRYYFEGSYTKADLDPWPMDPADRRFFQQYVDRPTELTVSQRQAA